MAGINVNMTEELRDFVGERMQKKGFSTPTEYFRHLVREDRDRAAQEELERLLLEGLNSGEPVRMTSDDWEEIRRTARERVASKKKRA